MPLDWDAQHKDKQPAGIARPELPCLQGIEDPDARLFLRFYLRSNIERDQETAKQRCEAYGVNYQRAKDEANQ